jgi:hypothetical protein
MQDESGHLLGEYSGSGSLIDETIWLGNIPVATLQPNGSGGVNIYWRSSNDLVAGNLAGDSGSDFLTL